MESFLQYDSKTLALLDAQAQAMLSVFATNSYARVEPSILQPADAFLDRSGEDVRRRTFVLNDSGGQELCLRPDLTIPVCRMFLARGTKATARYAYHGPVFRLQPNAPDQPSQFLHTGIEYLGENKRDAADFEVLTLAVEALRAAGLKSFMVQLGDVGLFSALIDALDIPPMWRGRLKRHFWRPAYFSELLKRLSGDGRPTVQANLASLGQMETEDARAALEGLMDYLGATPDKPIPGGRTRKDIVERLIEQAGEASALQLDKRIVQLIEKVRSVSGGARESLGALRKLVAGAGIKLSVPLAKMESRIIALEKLGLNGNELRFAASFGRNMEYYTGFVFELWSQGSKDPVQLAGGGRYDSLLRILGAKQDVPAVGCAILSEPVLAVRRASRGWR